MLSLSQSTGYAVLALSQLEGPEGEPRLVRDIAGLTGIPKPYLSKLMHMLAQKGLIVSRRGQGGGVVLSRPTRRISIVDIAEAIEGQDWLPQCLLGSTGCWEGSVCPTVNFWAVERLRIERKLQKVSLAHVAKAIKKQTEQKKKTRCALVGSPDECAGSEPCKKG